MAKYSTDSSSGGGGTTCELCGAESDALRTATIAGARLEVCPDCAPHDDEDEPNRSGSSESNRDRDRKKQAARNVAKANPVWDGDSEHWEREGTNYDDDQLPYLVSDYGDRLEATRQAAGLQRDELAEELGAREADLLAIEQGRATQAGVGGGLVAALEERLDVTLSE